MASILIDTFTATNDGGGTINELVNVYFDDVAFTVSTPSLLVQYTASDRTYTSGQLIYSHTDGNTRYDVHASTSNPFATVTPVDITPVCDLTAGAANVVHESTAGANDGQVSAPNATTSNGPIQYSLDGLTYQTGNSFTGLPAGSYTIYLKDAANCTAQINNITVNAGASGDDLAIDQAATDSALVHETTPGAADGIINVIATSSNAPIQYSLDNVIFQTSQVFSSLPAGNYVAYVKDLAGYTDQHAVTINAGSAQVCDLGIVNGLVVVTHETAPGAADGTIDLQGATSTHGPVEYSLDNQNYFSTSLFIGLPPGIYRGFLRDALGCRIISNQFAIQSAGLPTYAPYQTTINPVLAWSKTQSHRLVKELAPGYTRRMQNFENMLFSDMRFTGLFPERYFQKVHTESVSRVQWWSNFDSNYIEVQDIKGNLQRTIPSVKVKANLAYSVSAYSATTADFGNGFTQIAFENDLLPEWAKTDQVLTIVSGGVNPGNYQINSLTQGSGTMAGKRVALIAATYTGGGQVSVTSIDVTYDRFTYDVYEASIDWNTFATGQFQILVKGSKAQFGEYLLRSEPIQVVQSYKGLNLVTWGNANKSFGTDYQTGIQHQVLVESRYTPEGTGGESTAFRASDRRLVKLEDYATATYKLATDPLPFYMHQILSAAFSHTGFVSVNEVQIQATDKWKASYYESSGTALGTGEISVEELAALGDNNPDLTEITGTASALVVDGKILDVDK